jgi:hypothetical protein
MFYADHPNFGPEEQPMAEAIGARGQDKEIEHDSSQILSQACGGSSEVPKDRRQIISCFAQSRQIHWQYLNEW